MRRLRGTPLDLFGLARVRRIERALVAEYRAMVEGTLRDLSPDRHERALRIARLPDLVRGYEDVKLRNVQRFHDEARALGAQG
jgi:indolepyruvate ferredoxin oxidoreductase